MRHDAPIPVEFATLASKIHFVRQVGKNEYSSSCPECGGGMHPDGRTYPDRFRMWPVSKYGKPLGWCRSCGYTWTPDKERKPTIEEIEAWRLERIRDETERKLAAEHALKLLNDEHLWERFYRAQTDQSREICREWGIPDTWQDYLKIGYVPEYKVYNLSEGLSYKSPAITMPVWWAGNVVHNIKVRVLQPQHNNDRYRNIYKTGEQYLYMPLHDVEFDGGGIILVEGEKKAIVTEVFNPTSYRVIGMQSKKPAPELFSLIANCEPVYIIPDPDAFISDSKDTESGVNYLLRNIGSERVRVVRLPVKVDDGLVKHHINLSQYIQNATKG
jgi:hypothetical protein